MVILSKIGALVGMVPPSLRLSLVGIVGGAVLGAWLYAQYGPRPEPEVVTETRTEVQERIRTVTVERETKPDGTVIEREVTRDEDRAESVATAETGVDLPKNAIEISTYVSPSQVEDYDILRNYEVTYARRIGNSRLFGVVSARPSEPEISIGIRLEF